MMMVFEIGDFNSAYGDTSPGEPISECRINSKDKAKPVIYSGTYIQIPAVPCAGAVGEVTCAFLFPVQQMKGPQNENI
jgi:hypothetical protein